MDEANIKENLRAARKRKKITQEELAAKINLSETAIKDLERKGGTKLFNKHLFKILKVLELDLEIFFYGYASKSKAKQLEEDAANYKNNVKELLIYVHKLESYVINISTDNGEICSLIKENQLKRNSKEEALT